jgi:hypothetical protein
VRPFVTDIEQLTCSPQIELTTRLGFLVCPPNLWLPPGDMIHTSWCVLEAHDD